MRRARYGRMWQLLGLLSLALSVLMSCDSGGGEDNVAQSTSRLTLRLTSPDQTHGLPPRTVLPAQTGEPLVASLQITISGDGIDIPPIVCTLFTPSTDPRCETRDDATTLVVMLSVPQGNDRRIVVTAFDDDGTALFLGRETVTLSQPTTTVIIELLRLATPEDLENRSFIFPDGVAFGLSGQEVRLAFGAFEGTPTAPVMLQVPATEGSATGMATVASVDLVVTQSNIPEIPSGAPGLSFDATVNSDTSLNLTNMATDATSTSVPLSDALLTTVVGNVEDQNSNRIAGAAITTTGGLTGFTAADGTFSIPNVPTNLGDIAASAAFTSDQGITFTGSSPNVPPVPDGQTDVGTIVVLLVQSDTAILTSNPFQIPAGFNTLAFTFNFLSNEFPEFVGNIFDDRSIALVRMDSMTVETRALASVNNSSFSPTSGTGFNGQTGFLTATFDVSSLAGSATPVTLVISVLDVGDNVVDSAILIDNIRLINDNTGSVQPVPNGNFESGDFANFTVSLNSEVGPIARVITGLGSASNPPEDNIVSPQGSFMALLATGADALTLITTFTLPDSVPVP